MFQDFLTKTGTFFLKLIARLPFSVVYFLSDILFVVLYYLVGYRKKVVFDNLRNSFPHKTEAEIKAIALRFFHHFCDLTLETIKLQNIKQEELQQRIQSKNHDIINQFLSEGRSVTVLGMHYGNWEWTTFLATVFKGKTLAVYKPLHNKRFDFFMNRIRARFGAELVKNNHVLRKVLTAEKERTPVIIWLAGDQTPPWFHNNWFVFLKQEAIFYTGPAFIAGKFNTSIVFQTIRKNNRGFYTSEFELLIENPATMNENEIIKTYIRKMEQVIEKNPEYYLWSHKRWKYRREAHVPLNN